MCADTNGDDCINLSEFKDMLKVGFGEVGEATLDALAFTKLEEFPTDYSYSADDKMCARLFLKLDKNGDRILQPGELKTYINEYADPATVG